MTDRPTVSQKLARVFALVLTAVVLPIHAQTLLNASYDPTRGLYNSALLARNAERFPPVPTFTVAENFGAWPDVPREHFGDGGVFNQVTKR